LLGSGVPVGVWLTVVLWVANALLAWTALNRLRAALREVAACP